MAHRLVHLCHGDRAIRLPDAVHDVVQRHFAPTGPRAHARVDHAENVQAVKRDPELSARRRTRLHVARLQKDNHAAVFVWS